MVYWKYKIKPKNEKHRKYLEWLDQQRNKDKNKIKNIYTDKAFKKLSYNKMRVDEGIVEVVHGFNRNGEYRCWVSFIEKGD